MPVMPAANELDALASALFEPRDRPKNLRYRPQRLDAPPFGWFPLDVMRDKPRSSRWSVLMVDVDPDELKFCTVVGPALLFVHPSEYRPGDRVAQQCWVRVPGRHLNREAAWESVLEMIDAGSA